MKTEREEGAWKFIHDAIRNGTAQLKDDSMNTTAPSPVELTVRDINADLKRFCHLNGISNKWKFSMVGSFIAVTTDVDATVREASQVRRHFREKHSALIREDQLALGLINENSFGSGTIINFTRR